MARAARGVKGAALSGVIMAGVVLATPVWFLAFGFLVGTAPIYLLALLAVIVNAYAAGFILCNHLAKTALIVPEKEDAVVMGEGSSPTE